MVTDEVSFDSGDDELYRISLGLHVSSDSDTDDDEVRPARTNRLMNESVVPDASDSTVAKPRPATPPPTVTCRRCADVTSFGAHAKRCPKKSKYRRYVECPRCRAIMLTRAQLRQHLDKCLAGDPSLTAAQRRTKYSPEQLMTTHPDELQLAKCEHCKQYRQFDNRILALHEVLCRGVEPGKPPPRLPSRASLLRQDGDVELPLKVAVAVSKIFKRFPRLQVSVRVGFLYRAAERVITLAPPQVLDTPYRGDDDDAPPKRTLQSVVVKPPPKVSPPAATEPPPERHVQVSARDVTPQRQEALTQLRGKRPARFGVGLLGPTATASVAPASPQAKRRRSDPEDPLPAALTAHAFSVADIPPPPPPPPPPASHCQTATLPPPTPTLSPATQPPVLSPAHQPAAVATARASTESVPSPPTTAPPSSDDLAREQRDRCKILLPTGQWVDTFNRPTSPRRQAKQRLPKPCPSMTGHLTAVSAYVPHTTVAVSGHLPSGWGRIITPDGQAHASYKATPGDEQEVPEEAKAMTYWIPFFLTTPGADNKRPPVGPLYTPVDLSQHSSVEYRAAGCKSRLTITTAAQSLGGQEGQQ